MKRWQPAMVSGQNASAERVPLPCVLVEMNSFRQLEVLVASAAGVKGSGF
jgi:hypothetical protein